MKIMPEAVRDLPTALPTADISTATPETTGSEDLIFYGKQFSDFRISLMDKTGETVSFVDMEVQLWGYYNKDSKPVLFFSDDKVDGAVGKEDLPVDKILAYDYIYIRQSTTLNAIGGTGASNPAGSYQFVWNNKDKGNN